MSSSPEEAGTAAAQGAPGSPEAEAIQPLKQCISGFNLQINKVLEDKKKEDNKLADNVAELKKEGSAILEELIKQQPEPDQTKFLKDFYKAFDAKKIPEAKKQLKSKGLPDLRATMGRIVHTTFYDQVVLPGLAKKERPGSDKFLEVFGKNFDKELDVILKKKEFKMYKDAAADFGGQVIQSSIVAKTQLETLEKSNNTKQLQEEMASLKKDNQRLERDVSHLTQEKEHEKKEAEYTINGLEDRNKILKKRDDDNYDAIAELETRLTESQKQLATESHNFAELQKGQVTMQKKVKDLEEKLGGQEDRWEAEHARALEAEEKLAPLKEKVQALKDSLQQANESWSTASQDYENLKMEIAEGTSSQDAEAQKTIETLRNQAEKKEKELSDLKKARDDEVRNLTADLNQSRSEAQEEKNKYTSLADDLAAAKKEAEDHKNAAEEHKKEAATLKEKHEELVKKHDDAVRVQETNVGANDEEQERMVRDMKRRIDKLVESERSLDILAKEQRKCMKEDESKLKEFTKSEANLKKEVEKLNKQLKEQTEKAKKLGGAAGKKSNGADAKKLEDLEAKNQTLRDDIIYLKERKGALEADLLVLKEQVPELENRINELNTVVAHYKAVHEKDTAQAKELNTVHEFHIAQIKELNAQNAEFRETLKKAPTTGNGGLDTLSEEPEEDDDMTPEQRMARYQKNWADATARLNDRDAELAEAKRQLQHLVSSFERSEKRVDDLQVALGLRDEEHEAAVAEIQNQLDEALALVAANEQQVKDALAAAADSEGKFADAVAAAAAAGGSDGASGSGNGNAGAGAGGSAPDNATAAGPSTTLGEATLAPRDPRAAVRGVMRPSRFAGLTEIFGRNRNRGGHPYAPAPGDGGADGSPLENYLFPVLLATLVLVICALFTMGAEGHKASIWYAANHLTRAQYANDWYYLTIPLPQWEYVFYFFRAMLSMAK